MVSSVGILTRSHQKTVWSTNQPSALVVILMFTVVSVKASSLKCTEGANVTFDCSCAEGFDYCRFKKLFQQGNIVRDGVVGNDHQRFIANGTSSDITLKGCKKDDEGTYVSMCGGSDLNKEFHLEVLTTSNESLTCRAGGKVSFRCPCCPEKLDSFTFKTLGGDIIVQKGALNNHHSKYELSENKTQVTLKKCSEDDKGTYVWTCDTHQHFLSLTISEGDMNKEDAMKSSNHSKRTSTPVAVLFLFSFILVLFA